MCEAHLNGGSLECQRPEGHAGGHVFDAWGELGSLSAEDGSA